MTKRTWLLAALPVIALCGIAVHELAHAAAVWALGGEVHDIRVLPTIADGALVLGQVTHDASTNARVVHAAPFVLWLTVAAIAVARRRPPAAVIVFVLVPLVDISFAFGGFTLGVPNTDLAVVAAGFEPWLNLAFAVTVLSFGVLAHRQLADQLSTPEFAIGYGVILLAPWLIFLV